MKALIVADTGPLIILAKIGQLSLLTQRYQRICIPQTVLHEATVLNHKPASQAITAFVDTHPDTIAISDDMTQDDADYLDFGLDAGETQAILLAKQQHCPVLLDEKRGRNAAKREHVEVLGTVGLLLAAKREGLIPAIAPLLDAMQAHDYRLADTLVAEAKRLAGE